MIILLWRIQCIFLQVINCVVISEIPHYKFSAMEKCADSVEGKHSTETVSDVDREHLEYFSAEMSHFPALKRRITDPIIHVLAHQQAQVEGEEEARQIDQRHEEIH